MNNKKILITGKDGYIATNLSNFLSERGYQVEIVDLLDKNWITKDFSSFDVLIHTAALVHQNERNHSLEDYYQVNALLTESVAIKARNEGISQFIFLSSQSVYGKVKHITKNTKPIPQTKYGKSKLLAEKKLHLLETDSFNVLILRPPMIYGYGCKGNYNQLRNFALKYHLTTSGFNKKSLLHISNFCSFIEHAISIKLGGTYCPQDTSYHSTPQLMMAVGRVHFTKVRRSICFSFLIFIAKLFFSKAKKAFASNYIDYALSQFPDNYKYWIYCNFDAVKASEFAEKPKNLKQIEYGKISIIMPVYNSGPYIKESIQSVLKQTYKNFELIIVNDCSTDNSDEIIKQFLFDKRVIYLTNEKNSGTSVTRNFGLRNASGQYIAFLDSDDLYLDNYLENQLKFINENNQPLIYSNYYIFNAKNVILFKVSKTSSYRKLLYQNVMAPLATMYDRSILGLHYMREDIVKPEDFVYWLEIVEQTGKVKSSQVALGKYRITPNSKSRNKLELIKYMFMIYHKVERENVFLALHHLFWWGVTGLIKYGKIK